MRILLATQTVPPLRLMCLPDVSFPAATKKKKKRKRGWPTALAWMKAGAGKAETGDLYFKAFLKCKFQTAVSVVMKDALGSELVSCSVSRV